MPELVFYTNPMSRGRIVRWMLEEVGQPYRTEFLDYATTMKAPEYLAINPMGKVPAIVHGDQIVTECAAICTYLAEAFPEAGLLPAPSARGAYYRWMFFAAGPVESAVAAAMLGVDPTEDKIRRTVGWGDLNTVADALAGLLSDGRPWLMGEQFSALDCYLGSQIIWGRQFHSLPERDGFDAYIARATTRPAALRAVEIDNAAMPKQA